MSNQKSNRDYTTHAHLIFSMITILIMIFSTLNFRLCYDSVRGDRCM